MSTLSQEKTSSVSQVIPTHQLSQGKKSKPFVPVNHLEFYKKTPKPYTSH